MALATTQATREARAVLEQLAACNQQIITLRDECSLRVQQLLDMHAGQLRRHRRQPAFDDFCMALPGQAGAMAHLLSKELDTVSGGLLVTLAQIRPHVDDPFNTRLAKKAVYEPLVAMAALQHCLEGTLHALHNELGFSCNGGSFYLDQSDLASRLLARGHAACTVSKALLEELATCLRLPLDMLVEHVDAGLVRVLAALRSDDGTVDDCDCDADGCSDSGCEVVPLYLTWASDLHELLERGERIAHAAGVQWPQRRLRDQLGALCSLSPRSRLQRIDRIKKDHPQAVFCCLALAAAELERVGCSKQLVGAVKGGSSSLAASQQSLPSVWLEAETALMAILRGPELA